MKEATNLNENYFTMNSTLSHINLPEIKEAYERGENIMHFIEEKYGELLSREQIIEISYDLQAGTYIANYDADSVDKYTLKHFELIREYFTNVNSVLDVGCGELCNTQALFNRMNNVDHFFACDISFSRCQVGKQFYQSHVDKNIFDRTKIFVGELLMLPFEDNSIDLIVTSHALEPNGGKEEIILSELLRVARKGLVLLEPSYELSDDAQRQRMDSFNYIKGIPDLLQTLSNAKVLHNGLTTNYINPQNRTAAFVIQKTNNSGSVQNLSFVDPVSKTGLIENENYFYSPIRGVSYPVIENLPILRPNAGIITSSLSR
ncbi:MAG: class I SAM-dependent methyltransferase [Emcibacteraceae bacterium]|nr:class I SAM-dependent methyltransferase [Emcibacteraceae bacterium]